MNFLFVTLQLVLTNCEITQEPFSPVSYLDTKRDVFHEQLDFQFDEFSSNEDYGAYHHSESSN